MCMYTDNGIVQEFMNAKFVVQSSKNCAKYFVMIVMCTYSAINITLYIVFI